MRVGLLFTQWGQVSESKANDLVFVTKDKDMSFVVEAFIRN